MNLILVDQGARIFLLVLLGFLMLTSSCVYECSRVWASSCCGVRIVLGVSKSRVYERWIFLIKIDENYLCSTLRCKQEGDFQLSLRVSGCVPFDSTCDSHVFCQLSNLHLSLLTNLLPSHATFEKKICSDEF